MNSYFLLTILIACGIIFIGIAIMHFDSKRYYRSNILLIIGVIITISGALLFNVIAIWEIIRLLEV